MIQYLRIQNLALMEEATLDFEGGFVAVTGETGAGKSVLLGALSLLSGARGDKGLIRRGADTLEVEAILQLKNRKRIDQVLKSLDLPETEDGQLLLKRALSRSKAPKVYINGTLTTMARLQSLGESWIDFHGPGEPQKLFAESWQRYLLDSYAKLGNDLARYREGYELWQEKHREMDRLRQEKRLNPEEQAFLKKELQQIERLPQSEEGISELERDHARLTSAQDLASMAGKLQEGLTGNNGVTEKLSQLLGLSRELKRLDPESASLADRLESLIIESDDLGESFADLLSETEFDPQKAEKVESQMEDWLSVKRKYGHDIATVLEKYAELSQRLNSQGDLEGTLIKLQHEADELRESLVSQAEEIREARVKAAHQLAKDAGKLLNKLGFKKARFQIEIIRDRELGPHGNSHCSYLFNPNPGQDLLPLNKIASSGELARVMLALKAVLAKVDETPVLVFDEVDSNIGGEVSSIVGEELEKLGTAHQVFCITHIPQVAARADHHFVVDKEQSEDSTRVEIRKLTGTSDELLGELARMLGDRKSKSAREHARELLGNKFRNST